MREVRCECGKKLGDRDRDGRRLHIEKLGVIIVGGMVGWRCPRCNRQHAIDLEGTLRLPLDAAAV